MAFNLETRNIQLPPAAKELLPQKNSTIFQSWEPITYESYCRQKFTESFVEAQLVTVKDLFFRAVLQRGRGTLGFNSKIA